ncbi:MAG: hypothetical protein AVDCRST_MAG66-4830 [uncultured Pseudonocardia sp.]|uniref:Uncharacterized protein n=1 Tax=uncultured Pseudonocardia sp. TaxID=211455 RepID=A0A6J4QNM7_9PSEU|nr:MAG: hypothetical protein AVDCRST_MAG66-4830 [uncultured Pseudonocardia sp.]
MLVDSGVTDRTVWTELVYVVDGRRWWQRHEWVPLHEQVVLTTAQAPHEDAPSLRQALATVVAGLRPRRSDGEVAFALTR